MLGEKELLPEKCLFSTKKNLIILTDRGLNLLLF